MIQNDSTNNEWWRFIIRESSFKIISNEAIFPCSGSLSIISHCQIHNHLPSTKLLILVIILYFLLTKISQNTIPSMFYHESISPTKKKFVTVNKQIIINIKRKQIWPRILFPIFIARVHRVKSILLNSWYSLFKRFIHPKRSILLARHSANPMLPHFPLISGTLNTQYELFFFHIS